MSNESEQASSHYDGAHSFSSIAGDVPRVQHSVPVRIAELLKRRRNVFPALFIVFAALSLTGANQAFGRLPRSRALPISTRMSDAKSARIASAGDSSIVYGPRTFNETDFGTQHYVEQFDAVPGSTYTLKAENLSYTLVYRLPAGTPPDTVWLAAGSTTIALNGVTIFTPSTFGAARDVKSAPVILQGSNTLDVTIDGSTGVTTLIRVTVLGAPDPTYTLYGPKLVKILSGKSRSYTDSFNITSSQKRPYKLTLINADSGTTPVAAAAVTLNGTQVVAASEVTPSTTKVEKTVSLITGKNKFTVDISKSSVGNGLSIRFAATDSAPPVLTIAAPAANAVTGQTQIAVNGTVTDQTVTNVKVDGAYAMRTGTNWSITVPVTTDGPHTFQVSAIDAAGNHTDSTRTITRDASAPLITLTSPTDNSFSNQTQVAVSGTVTDATQTTVNVNGVPLTVGTGGVFSGTLAVNEGVNFATVAATDAAGNTASVTRKVTRDTHAPVLAVASPSDGLVTGAQTVTVSGTVTDATTVSLTVNGASVAVNPEDGTFSTTAPLSSGGNAIRVVATDAATNSTTVTRSVTRQDQNLPPDPATIAPVVNRTVATDVSTASSFLYSGANPIQTGVADGTISAFQASVLRGRLVNRDGSALSGATVTVLGRPEFGQTISRSDGGYDLAVNGGEQLILNFQKSGYLTAQRPLVVRRQDWVGVDPVALVQLDSVATAVDLNAAAAVARGSVQSDASGSRRETMIFEQGTQATMTLPNGTTQPLTSLTVRATEYTVGPNGPAAMPAALPPGSAYTYAVELSVDEALAASATGVQFSKPVAVYNENFMGFPVGMQVPVASYDRVRAMWVPSPNGRVIKILANNAGVADVDVDGTGTPASDSMLTNLGFDQAERTRLAQLYQPGQELWRYELRHFSPVDPNWPYPKIRDEMRPNQVGDKADPSKAKCGTDACQDDAASRIDYGARSVREALPVAGTELLLAYSSDRVPDYRQDYQFDVPLTDSVPADVLALMSKVLLRVQVAGRVTLDSFPPEANKHTVVTWDGRDAYGRLMQGRQRMTIEVGFVYPALAYSSPVDASTSSPGTFGQSAGTSLTQSMRAPATVWQTVLDRPIGAWDNRAAGLGGWTLSAHHEYEPLSGILHLGSGKDIIAGNFNPVLAGVSGSIDSYDIVFLADGGMLSADRFGGRIYRISKEGVKTIFAGDGSASFRGDGGPALDAGMSPASIARAPDGSIYVRDGTRIRRIDTTGVIATIAGDSTCADDGDDGPAALAHFCTTSKLRFGPDGSLYMVELNQTGQGGRIRRIAPDGTVSTFAGIRNAECRYGRSDPCQDNVPALGTPLGFLGSVDVGRDGTVYVADITNALIWKITPDGIRSRAAGRIITDFVLREDGDGGPALNAGLGNMSGRMAVAPDGSLYYATSSTVRRVDPHGIINTVAGGGQSCNNGSRPCLPNANARQLGLTFIEALTVAPDNVLHIGDTAPHRILRLTAALPGFSASDIIVPSEDGSEVYRFDATGKHLTTLDGIDGAVLLTFDYDSTGLLSRIQHRDGSAVVVERQADGSPRALVSPFGQRTSLSLDAFGYLAQVQTPGIAATQLVSTEGGLMLRMTEPGGGVHEHQFDSTGYLVTDKNPGGATLTISKQDSLTAQKVSVTTALGHTTAFVSGPTATGGYTQAAINEAGAQSTESRTSGDSATTRFADGTVLTAVAAPDPRFGMQVPYNRRAITRLPSGLTMSATAVRRSFLTDPANLFSITQQIDSVVINGHVFVSTYDASQRLRTSTSATGRVSTARFDSLGREVESQFAGLPSTTTTYDQLDRVATVQRLGRLVSFAYDSAGNLVARTGIDGRAERFSYDSSDRLATTQSVDGRILRYGYDANGNISSVTLPSGATHRYEYTPDNLLRRYVPPSVSGLDSTATSFVYDADRSLTQVLRPDGVIVTVGYDSSGRVSTVKEGGRTITHTYSPTSGLVSGLSLASSTDVWSNNALAIGYDGAIPNVLSMSGAVAGTVAFAYDMDLRVRTIAVNGDSVAFTYDADGALTQAGGLTIGRAPTTDLMTSTTLGNITTTVTRDSLTLVRADTVRVAGVVLYAYELGRDSLGKIIQRRETIDGSETIQDYAYDSASQLRTVSVNGQVIAAYEYDANGNRVRRTTSNGVEVGAYDAQDRLQSYGDATLLYSAAGELSRMIRNADTTRYAYDALGALRSVVLPNGTRIDYVIDPGGNRIAKRVNGVQVQGFLYEGDLHIAAELDGQNHVVSRFVYGLETNVPEYMVKNGTTYRLITDHLGSVRLVVDANTGVAVQRIDYDEYGRVTVDSNPGFQPFGYAGGLVDDQTGLVRFGRRDYDPSTGRWTTRDPSGLEAGFNLYAYVSNDPINIADPTGRCPCEETGGGTKKKINSLDPEFAKLVRQFIEEAAKQGIHLVVDLAYRSEETQNDLYKIGRTQDEIDNHTPKHMKDGAQTDAWGGTSYHNFGLAIDVDAKEGDLVKKEKYTGKDGKTHTRIVPTKLGWQLGALGERLGLGWGNDFGDPRHFQWVAKPGKYSYTELKKLGLKPCPSVNH